MDTLVRQYEKPIYHAAYRLLGNADDAADVTQTTFMQAFRNLGQYNPAFRFYSWLYRIAVNEALDTQQGRQRLQTHADVTLASLTDPAPEPEAAASRSEAHEDLQQALLALPVNDRTPLVLHYFAGMSYRQIAEILEVPEKTVKSRLFSARQRLKHALERTGLLEP